MEKNEREKTMATSKDVARKAGVSTATVSRVYQCPELVRPKTKSAVMKAAKELNYYPNFMARNLKQNKSYSIGIAVNDFINPFYFQVIEQMNKRLENTKYQLLTFSSSGNDYAKDKIVRYLGANQLDAFLFSPAQYNARDKELFAAARQYCLQLYADAYDFLDSIVIDDIYGSYLAVKHLLENGHRDIMVLFFGTPEAYPDIGGYLKAYEEMKITPNMEYIRGYPYEKEQIDAIKQDIIRMQPTAILTHAETITIWTLSILKELGLKFPEDISMISYDNYPWGEIMGITSVAQPISLVGNTIVDTVLEVLSTKSTRAIVKKKIQPELILRNSVEKI